MTERQSDKHSTGKTALVARLLIGKTAKADHPITCLNPAPTFKIFGAKIANDRIFVRGEETMWFGESVFEVLPDAPLPECGTLDDALREISLLTNRYMNTVEDYYLHGLWRARDVILGLQKAAPAGSQQQGSDPSGKAACAPGGETAPAGAALSATQPRPRTAYIPMTEREIDMVRACLDDGTYTKQEQKDFGLLCDMATNALLFAQEATEQRNLAASLLTERDELAAVRSTTQTTSEPVMWARDLDGTGSLHACAQGDDGAIPLYALSATQPREGDTNV